MTLYKNKYRVETVRLKKWDYSSPGYYFITICTKNRQHSFGQIVDGKMVLSKIGKIANQFWLEIPHHFNNIDLDEFIVMPNHIHGIVIINTNTIVETPKLGVSTGNDGNKGNCANVGIIINQYKRICTIQIRKTDLQFGWQPRFYDHIIRNGEELNRIQRYIMDNPSNWEKDENYSTEVTP